MTAENKLPLTSSNVTAEVLAKLREIAPQVFTEGGVDFDKLKATLGENIVPKDERYGLSWAGKSEAFRNVQIPSVGTLLPQPEESINFDTSENLIIEGDNLEALKLLQKSYHGKIKVIYIDPPYNTGNEFIYPDNFREGLDDYLKYSGQLNDEGQRNSSETDTSGRFHSKWLNMMYPRLFLARNLLCEDGVIFVSIDDNEVHNLRMLMNEVFGEENFIAQLVWKKKYTGGQHAKFYADFHEYILVFARLADAIGDFGVARTNEESEKFSETDEFEKTRGKFYTRPLKSNLEERKTLIYPIVMPDGAVLNTQWLVGKERFEREFAEKRIIFRQKKNGEWQVYKKYYQLDGGGQTKPPSLIERFPNTEAKGELKVLFNVQEGRDNIFYTVKPVNLIRHFLEPFLEHGDICLDFFAGSGTTAQAVMQLNSEDGGNRKFVLVQLPEKTDNSQYPTIADITRERVRRVIKKLNEESPLTHQDRGFKAFKLTSSNFKIWNADTTSTKPEAIAEQLRLYADNVERERTQQEILYELVLKSGLPLSAKVEQVQVAGKSVYSIAQGQLLICLESEISQAVLRGMIALTPIQMVCLDRAFGGNDQMKTNTVLEAKSQDVTFRTV